MNTEYFVCDGCGNRNRIDWDGEELSRVIPCTGCRFDEEVLALKLPDGSTVAMGRNDEYHRSLATKQPESMYTMRISHGKDINAVKGKGQR